MQHKAMTAHEGEEIQIAPHILNLNTRWRPVGRFRPRPIYSRGNPHVPIKQEAGPQSRSGRFVAIK
jgi:hypothetical protein